MLEILRAGIQTTVQDQGRSGFRHMGVAQAGALDAPAMWLANRLVNNAGTAAGLEVVAGPFEIRFMRDGWVALCGADFDATLDEQALVCGWRYPVKKGQKLRLRGPKSGTRVYLAFDGGIDVPVVMGSRSTDLKAGFGGHAGRALKKGDRLPLGVTYPLKNKLGTPQRQWTPEVRVLRGPEFDLFDEASRQSFFKQAWTVSTQSNRMGYRLQGTGLQRSENTDLLSHGVLPGVVQVPPNGQPIVLLADSQTTGGYPRIAVVITADLWKLAQAPLGRQFCFVETDLEGAKAARKQWQNELYRFEWSLYGK